MGFISIDVASFYGSNQDALVHATSAGTMPFYLCEGGENDLNEVTNINVHRMDTKGLKSFPFHRDDFIPADQDQHHSFKSRLTR